MKVNTLSIELLDKYIHGDGFLFYANLITNPELYENKAVFFIDKDGKDHMAESHLHAFGTDENRTFKIEQLEKPRFGISNFVNFIHEIYMTDTYETHDTSCHLFYASKDAPSFPTHTDPVNLTIVCIHGIKTMEISEELVHIPSGSFVHIPANIPHRAINKCESIMLSIGAEPRSI